MACVNQEVPVPLEVDVEWDISPVHTQYFRIEGGFMSMQPVLEKCGECQICLGTRERRNMQTYTKCQEIPYM